MPKVLKKFDECPTHTVNGETTLYAIARDHVSDEMGSNVLKRAGLLAQLNWGTQNPREVARALAETLGLSLKDAPDLDEFDEFSDVADLPLKPADPVDIRLPEAYTTEGLALEKEHKVKVRRVRPANTVSITALDKWFIPEKEKCRIGWRVGGLEATATGLELDVYGSKYCDFDHGANDDLGAYTETADLEKTPIYREEDVDHDERGAKTAEWDGISTATAGILKKPDAADQKRHVNVAFSPYTAHFRYRKVEGDKDARIELKPFWPDWDKDKARIDDTFKIKWKITGAGAKLKLGLLTIVDGKDRPVWRKALKAADLTSDADHECDWDTGGEIGKYAEGVEHDGKTEAHADHMPYRVRIEAHKPAHEEEGLALAAMHSEVRIFVHHETLRPDHRNYKVDDDKTSLLLSVADLNHKDADLTQAADGDMWVRAKLAEAGFHAGQVCATAPAQNTPLSRALADFQRSVPNDQRDANGKYQRLTMVDTGVADADTKRSLENMDARYKRPWFGKADDTRADYADNFGDEVRDVLRDPAKSMIVWIDDRHFYTDATWLNGVGPVAGPAARNAVTNHASTPKPTRDNYWDAADNRADKDAEMIERPWLPIQAQPVLLSRDRDLKGEDSGGGALDIKTVSDADLDIMRRAVGPIRVDWTFDEIDGDQPMEDADGISVDVPEIDTDLYGKHSRTKAALEWWLDHEKAEYDRKDVHRKAVYHNAPEAFGGIRPDNGARGGDTTQYYKAAFGREDDGHLLPWKTKDDSTLETVVTVAHDDLGPSQPADEKFKKRRGRAGVWFKPSIMAGDGYRVRARLCFEKQAGGADAWKLPNHEALKKRYPLRPQAQSAKMRNWRKSSVRAYVRWTPKGDTFAPAWADFKKQFAAAHVHYVTECAAGDPTALRAAAMMDEAAFKAVAQDAVEPGTGKDGQPGWMTFSDDYVWPWHDHDHLGVDILDHWADCTAGGHWDVKPTAAQMHGFDDNIWYSLSTLLTLKFAEHLEKELGLMRGNVILEYRASRDIHYMLYECNACHDFFAQLEKQAAPSEVLGACPSCAANQLIVEPTCTGHYTCASGHMTQLEEDGPDGEKHKDKDCATRGCEDVYTLVEADRVNYACDNCGYTVKLTHAGGHKDGSACPRLCGGAMHPTDDRYVASQNYKCDTCNHVEARNNAGNRKDEQAGQAHVCAAGGPGTFQPDDPPNIAYDFSQMPAPHLEADKHRVEIDGTCRKHRSWMGVSRYQFSSLGLSGGVAANFLADVFGKYECDFCGAEMTKTEDTPGGGQHEGKLHHTCTNVFTPGRWRFQNKTLDENGLLWAHEVSHNRHFTHSSNAGGVVDEHHDWENNPSAPDDVVRYPGVGVRWDRSCLMSYASYYENFDLEHDLTCMCYRCVLKNRGWKVVDPAKPPPGRIDIAKTVPVAPPPP